MFYIHHFCNSDENQAVSEKRRSTRRKTRQAKEMETSDSSGSNSNEEHTEAHWQLRNSKDSAQATKICEVKDAGWLITAPNP